MNKLTMLHNLRIDPSLQHPPIEGDQFEKPRSRQPAFIWLMVALAILLVAIVAYALGSGILTRSANKARTQTTAEPNGEQNPTSGSALDASGYIVALRQATVSSRLTGRLVEVRIEEGQYVKQGEVIAVVDQRAATAALSEAIAQLDQAQAVVAQAQVRLKQQRRTTDRILALGGQGFANRSAVDDAVSAVETLSLDLLIAQQRVAAATAARRAAQISVDDSLVRAPFAGVVITKAAEPGEIVSPVSAGGGFTRTGIGTIVDLDSLEGEIEVSERYVSRVQPGRGVRLIPAAYPSLTLQGCVIAVVPGVDRAKATLKVRVALKSYDNRILPNMAVRATFLDRNEPECVSGATR